MDDNQIMLMKKLGVFEILKESLKIPYKNPKFIVLTFLTSLPLVFIMILHEIILQTTMIDTKTFLTPPPPPAPPNELDYIFSDYSYMYDYWLDSFDTSIRLFRHMSPRFFQLGLLYLVPLHLLDLLNTIITVNSAWTIYAEEKPLNIREMVLRLVKEKAFKGPLITSIYVLSFNSFILCGLIWSVTNSIIPSLGNYFVILYGISSIVVLVKWMEWSAIWNMSIVFSVLEERHGLEAFALSGYFSRGNNRRGLYLMLVFFAWRIGLRLASVYLGGNEKLGALAATSVLSCTGNVMKWIVCTVYFYDCKKRVLEKKIYAEEGIKAPIADMVLVSSIQV